MKHYLVDTNVIVDLLLNREGADAAAALIDGAENGMYKLSLCALSYLISIIHCANICRTRNASIV